MRNLLTVGMTLILALVFASAHALNTDEFEERGDRPGTEASEETSEQTSEDTSVETNVWNWSWDTGLLGGPVPEGDIYAADESFPGLMCVGCRNPQSYPVDFAAFAYNTYYGDDAWGWELKLGIPFRIYNFAGEWVVIWFENILLDTYTLLPDTMTIVVRQRTGEILRLEVLEEGPDMPIGTLDPATSCACGGDGGGGGDGDGYDDMVDDPSDIDDDGPTGVVDIEDPDENGEFPDWAEEL